MLSFIVCAYNEEDNIIPTLETITHAAQKNGLKNYEIMIVNDGSRDSTEAKIKSFSKSDPKITSINNTENQGLGTSIRIAIDNIRYDSFMIVPGDNDMPEELISLLLRHRGQAETILTFPINKEQRSKMRNIISVCYQILYMISFDVYVNYINGPGIWSKARIQKVRLRSRRFSIISEMNVKALRTGSTYLELPGYFQAGSKNRSTVTIRNLLEVISSFTKLFIEIHVIRWREYKSPPCRIKY